MHDKETRSNNKGCDKMVKKPLFRHFTGVDFYTCPSNFFVESFAHWIDLSRHFDNGLIPLEIDSPNKNIEAMNFVSSLRSNYQDEKMKEANGR
jgi:hypothetical protein